MRAAAFRLCLFGALALAGVGGFLFLADTSQPPPGQAFVVEQSELHLGELPLGHHLVLIRLTNRSPVPRRILGMTKG
jgi:hypothetical protein